MSDEIIQNEEVVRPRKKVLSIFDPKTEQQIEITVSKMNGLAIGKLGLLLHSLSKKIKNDEDLSYALNGMSAVLEGKMDFSFSMLMYIAPDLLFLFGTEVFGILSAVINIDEEELKTYDYDDIILICQAVFEVNDMSKIITMLKNSKGPLKMANQGAKN